MLPRVTGGRIKKFIMGFSTRRLSMKLFQVARRKGRAWLFQVYPHFGDLYWSTLGCWNLPAFATVLSPKSALKARKLDMHVLQNGLVFIQTCRQFSSHRLKKKLGWSFHIHSMFFNDCCACSVVHPYFPNLTWTKVEDMLFLVKIWFPVCLVNVLCVQQVYTSGELGRKNA